MADCALGQPSWVASFASYRGFGHTPQEACSALGAAYNGVAGVTPVIQGPGDRCVGSYDAALSQVCSPPEIKPGEVGPVTLTAACPASAPCVFSMFTDGSIPSDVTAESIGIVMGFGLAAVLGLWVIGYGVALAVGLVRKL